MKNPFESIVLVWIWDGCSFSVTSWGLSVDRSISMSEWSPSRTWTWTSGSWRVTSGYACFLEPFSTLQIWWRLVQWRTIQLYFNTQGSHLSQWLSVESLHFEWEIYNLDPKSLLFSHLDLCFISEFLRTTINKVGDYYNWRGSTRDQHKTQHTRQHSEQLSNAS